MEARPNFSATPGGTKNIASVADDISGSTWVVPVGTQVSAKYKGAFCEARVRTVIKNIKVKVAYKKGGTGNVSDDEIIGEIRIGNTVEVKELDKKESHEATITKVQDCSQYVVVFDDGDITTLR